MKFKRNSPHSKKSKINTNIKVHIISVYYIRNTKSYLTLKMQNFDEKNQITRQKRSKFANETTF